MNICEATQKQSEIILSELISSGLRFSIGENSSLRIVGKATAAQIETCRKWKAQLVGELSPKCSNCGLPMQLIENGNLWFCSFGCESRRA